MGETRPDIEANMAENTETENTENSCEIASSCLAVGQFLLCCGGAALYFYLMYLLID